MTAYCALCDWKPDINAAPWAIYRPGERFPLWWTAEGIRTVPASASIGSTWPWVALVYHWHEEHALLLRTILGDYETAPGVTRTLEG